MSEKFKINANNFRRTANILSEFYDKNKNLLQDTYTKILPDKDQQAAWTAVINLNKSLEFEKRFSSIRNTEQEDSLEKKSNITVDTDQNVIKLIAAILEGVQYTKEIISQSLVNLDTSNFVLSDNPVVGYSFEDNQKKLVEYDINKDTINAMINNISLIEALPKHFETIGDNCEKMFNSYFQKLQDRHVNQGWNVYGNPVITDIAHCIYENIDSNGEVERGSDIDSISKYTISKGRKFASAITSGLMIGLVNREDSYTGFITEEIKGTIQDLISVSFLLDDLIKKLNDSCGNSWSSFSSKKLSHSLMEISNNIDNLKLLNPNTITKSGDSLINKEAKFGRDIVEESIKEIVDALNSKSSTDDVVNKILQRKIEVKKYLQEENTFYVCMIGAGNPFAGQAPGALSVIPGEKPNAKFEDIVGSGFTDVKEFYDALQVGSKWADLFVATSPSATADKGNLLMLGPPGCGKTMLLKAMGADKENITISAQGSDFETCWKGEAQKNPKRLFQECLKLRRESGKNVYALIDEIDSVTNKIKDRDTTDLTREFQILMDGIVSYPGVFIWGATNFPERIAPAILRRFNKVLIVGELNSKQINKLLKQYISTLPIGNIEQDKWDLFSSRLDGSTGDVIRKVADHIWRKKIYSFIKKQPSKAEELLNQLRSTSEDNKFDITKFNKEEREKFKNLLKSHIAVTESDIQSSIDVHLDNLSIQDEIANAKQTYQNARKIVSEIKMSEVA